MDEIIAIVTGLVITVLTVTGLGAITGAFGAVTYVVFKGMVNFLM